MLVEFIELNRDEIIRRCRAKVAARSEPAPTQAEVDHGVPMFLEQLGNALRIGATSTSEIRLSALLHGRELLEQGMTVSQVVHDYGDICQSITALAVETNVPISVDEFRMLNGCLDDAIAGAVTQYGRDRAQATKEDDADRENQRLGYFAHEVHNFIQTALVAFDALQSGKVGPGGSTGAVLRRSLTGVRDLIGRSLAEVRLTRGVQNPESFLVTDFIDELAASASLEAQAKGIELRLAPAPQAVAIYADRQVIMAVMMNVLQNAFKFTRPGTAVAVRVVDAGDRVRIEVEDECGGLPDSDVAALFVPFEQRGGDRSGLGLGLAFSHRAVEANAGHIFARDLPGVGCIFTVDLPRGRLSATIAGLGR